MKLLVDMNLSPLWVPFLNENGFKAIQWSDVGASTAPDTQIMERASGGGYVVLTDDLDFGALLAIEGSHGPSVVQIRSQDVLPNAIGGIVVNALRAAQSHLDSGALVTIDPVHHRIRLLPI